MALSLRFPLDSVTLFANSSASVQKIQATAVRVFTQRQRVSKVRTCVHCRRAADTRVRVATLAAWTMLSIVMGGCKAQPSSPGAQSDQGASVLPPVGRVPAGLGEQILAKVGDRTITVADYALVLDRMDRFERLRYQTPDRRRALLDELVNAELLAREAERRGLDKEPATQAYVSQLLVDEVRRRLRSQLPNPEDISLADVQAYYAAHRDEFRAPELRRIAVIALPNEAAARQLLQDFASAPTVEQWNRAASRQSIANRDSSLPVEVLGDLGFVSAPLKAESDDPKPQDNAAGSIKVATAIRAAAFEIETPGHVLTRPVLTDGAYYLVRLVGVSSARVFSLEEADANIRATLVNQRLDAAYERLHQELASAPVGSSGLDPHAGGQDPSK